MTLTNELERLLNRYDPLIHSVIKKYKFVLNDSALEYDDLLQEAKLGFVEAYHNYDPNYNVEFPTFATSVMKNKLSDFVCFQSNSIKFPHFFPKVWRTARMYELGINDVEQIAKLTNLPTKKVITAMKWQEIKKVKSYDETVTNNDGETFSKYEKQTSTEDDLTTLFVEEFLNTLDDETKAVVILKMDDLKHKEIGELFNKADYKIGRILREVSKQWVVFTLEGGIEND